jgi:DNA polymerase-4
LQGRIWSELSLPCSIGIAPNKLLAKMASDMKKPNGISILRRRDVPQLLWDKPCSHLFGIGRSTGEKLTKLNIQSIGQLATAEESFLTKHFGVVGIWLKNAANGIDESPVNPLQEASKSVGHTTTLPHNLTDKSEIERVFLNLADQVTRRLRRQQLTAGTVQITIRNPEMKTITRSHTLTAPTDNADDIYHEACRLFAIHWGYDKPVRLLGITLQSLQERASAAMQLDLFDFEKQPKKEQLTRAMDQIRDKYGENALLTAGMISNDPSALIRNHKVRGTSLQMDHLKIRNFDEN